ncbi:MAG: hydantoinase/oxoprolinase family protein [Euzebyales bacterium]|nr:hydantoinase/oxoprolinase family protein [Euzebyales bacterium]
MTAGPQVWRLGVDVGGTFTDIALLNEATGASAVHKTPTRADDLVGSVIQGIDEVLGETGVAAGDVAYVSAGSTIALNTIIEHSGCKAGLLVTKGFRDVLEIRRTRLPDAPNFNARRPVPLIRRALVVEAEERLHVSGRVLRPLDPATVHDQVATLVDVGVEAIAVSFLHSYVSPVHERLALDVIRTSWPDLFVCASSDIWPEQREYERTLVTVMNAYIGPRMGAYYGHLEQRLRALGMQCPLLVTQSNGGMISIAEAARTPVRTVLSGPAVGVTGAAKVTTDERPKLFTFDMGGTSADMAIVDEHPLLGTESLIGDYPLFMPAVSIDTIGAGGGSIAYRDSQGVLKVGPRSAGAFPGPAAYLRGGTEPTVTDAYLAMGIIGEHDLLGGAMEISRAAAETAIAGLAEQLGLTVEATAEGIIRVATANMYAELLPLIARHGVDYTEFTLMAFGGAGPAHGFMLASEVGIRSVLVPPSPGGMCAVGAALTDLQMDFVASGRWELSDSAAVKATYEELGERARTWLADQGLSEEEARFFRTADMRYEGQSYELTVDMDPGSLSADEFHRRYRDVYGYSDEGTPLEVLQLRLLVKVPSRALDRDAAGGAATARPEPVEQRSVRYLGETISVPVYRRPELPEDVRIDGPAVLVQYDTTTFVTPDFVFWREAGTGNVRGELRR